jgi:hypothetical protein
MGGWSRRNDAPSRGAISKKLTLLAIDSNNKKKQGLVGWQPLAEK